MPDVFETPEGLQCGKCGEMMEQPGNSKRRTTCPHCSSPAEASAGDSETASQHPGRLMGALAGLMPWVISALFHVSLGLVLLFIVMIVMVADAPKVVTVPASPFVMENNAWEWQEREPLVDMQPVDETWHPETNRHPPMPQPSIPLVEPTSVLEIIGTRANAPARDGEWGGFLGVRVADIPHSDPNPEGPPTTPPPAGGAAHVVYVLDRSGSMIDTFDGLRWELARSIGELRMNEGTSFHVIFFAAGRPLENSPRQLVAADRVNLYKAAVWMKQVSPEGQTDPVPAIERAFAVLSGARNDRPKIIYLLTDGLFPDNGKVLETIRRLNKDKSVHVCTFLYGNRPPEAVEVMRRIAQETNARYRYVSLDE